MIGTTALGAVKRTGLCLRSICILEMLAQHGPHRLGDLADLVGISDASACEHIRNLVDAGFVAKTRMRNPSTKGGKGGHVAVSSITPLGAQMVRLHLKDWDPELLGLMIRLYNAGYQSGHHYTVEGGFTDIHPSEMETHHAEEVQEIMEETI